jgi:leucyl aminopeptidase
MSMKWRTVEVSPAGETSADPVFDLPGIDAKTLRGPNEWIAVAGPLLDNMRRNQLRSLRLPACSTLGGEQNLEALLLGVFLYSFELIKLSGRNTQHEPMRLSIASQDVEILERAQRRAQAVNRARAWVEQPANILTPVAWVKEASQMLGSLGAKVEVLGPRQLQEMGANALFAVGRGSEHGAHLLVAEWRGVEQRTNWDVALVGKGLTFDAGGLNLKTQPNIAKMKLDMAGGAAVLGALELAIARRARANIVAIVPVAENVIDALAYRPGDVIQTLSGLTVEVADTDAEGRLVLADAITYGLRHYSPGCLVDLATLTTAVTRVLHEEFAGLYANDDELADELSRAGQEVGEPLWRLPLTSSLDYLVQSDIADLCNIGKGGLFGFGAGSPTAGAKFLEQFCGETRWAHIDITGMVWSGEPGRRYGKGATGFGVQTLDRWLQSRERSAVHLSQ